MFAYVTAVVLVLGLPLGFLGVLIYRGILLHFEVQRSLVRERAPQRAPKASGNPFQSV